MSETRTQAGDRTSEPTSMWDYYEQGYTPDGRYDAKRERAMAFQWETDTRETDTDA